MNRVYLLIAFVIVFSIIEEGVSLLLIFGGIFFIDKTDCVYYQGGLPVNMV